MAELPRVIEEVGRALAARLPQAWAIYAFGSLARGDARPDSDLDLAVLLPPGARLRDKLGLIAELSRLAGREVDLVDLREANLDLVHQVLREGQTLRITNESEVLGWEAERMSAYADFNPRRRDIVDHYLRQTLRGPA
ncbi:Nucleotidyltransferase domain-containing protein [Fontimonas thermophila]|uniref:Nucleotidyltransferase domain-containing protein n=1 Tax=Fontimonas thermophila TaxID=1076937 RepID=A0A1I2KBS4_9GAMM|nr:nucleotidyltransferase domain-containing protein [Fontimonas thermophila]SFF64532.1 Nucleotidyltransferase domain-containing protein [Fontimonas thermophila]